MASDEALFEQLVGGDLRAFDALYARYERPLFGFVRAQLGDAAEAEDVLHEAFLAVLRERGARAEVRSFRSWIYQVARNLCLNRVRSRKRAGRAAEAVAQAMEDEERSVQAGAEHALVGRERAARLQAAVARLPDSLAELYRLRASGMSYEDVAEVLGVPVGTLKSRMHEMVRRLREEVP